MELLVDIGNSNIKWLPREKLGQAPVSRIPHNGDPETVTGMSPPYDGVEQVLVCSVAGEAVESAFSGWCEACFGVSPRFYRASASAAGLSGVELPNFFVTLVLLGIGWNFGLIGATSMLTGQHTPEERGRVQGMNDTIMMGGVTLASLASGSLMNCTGGSAEAGWAAVHIATLPLLGLAGAALIWLTLHPRQTA